jgi:hypothetical protein
MNDKAVATIAEYELEKIRDMTVSMSGVADLLVARRAGEVHCLSQDAPRNTTTLVGLLEIQCSRWLWVPVIKAVAIRVSSVSPCPLSVPPAFCKPGAFHR